jgi:hypothetical protein
LQAAGADIFYERIEVLSHVKRRLCTKLTSIRLHPAKIRKVFLFFLE